MYAQPSKLQFQAMQSRSHEKWTTEEEQDLLRRIRDGAFPSEIARDLGRSELAIRSRLVKHALLPPISEDDLAHFSSLRSPPSEKINNDLENPELEPAELAEAIEIHSTPKDIQQAFHRFHFVYTIVNTQSQVYVGYSQDVWHRVGQHNRNKGAKATRNKGPWFPFFITCLAAEIDARALESEIQRNFDEFSKRSEMSLKEVLAQIGVPFELQKIALVR
jgi:predicted GIY-YIG superfamily endonuclease